MSEFLLRAATEADYDFMKRVGHEGLRPQVEVYRDWNQAAEDEGFNQIFNPAQQTIVVADGLDVGYLHLTEDASGLWIAGLYLDRSYQARGLGSAVLEWVLARAGAEGRPVRLRVHRWNPAVALYRRCGFRIESQSDTQFVMVWEPMSA